MLSGYARGKEIPLRDEVMRSLEEVTDDIVEQEIGFAPDSIPMEQMINFTPDSIPIEQTIDFAPDGLQTEQEIWLLKGGRTKAHKEEKAKRLTLGYLEQELRKNYFFVKDGSGKLYFFDGEIYRRIDRKVFLKLLRRILPEKQQQKFCSTNILNSLEEWMLEESGVREISRQEEARDRYKIAFRNGVWDAKSQEWMEFSENIFVFRQIDARFSENCREPEQFLRFLHTMSGGDDEIVEQIWEMIGYLLLPTMEGKCFFVFGTAPDSGKSIFANFLSDVLGREHVSRRELSKLRGQFALGPLLGKWLNVSMELQNKVLTDEEVANLKILTGEETIQVEKKFQEATAERMACKMVFGTNSPLRCQTYDEAFWNRVRIIPFSHTCPKNEQDLDLKDKLLAERDQIMTIAARKAGVLIENKFVFKESEAAAKMKESWQDLSRGNIEKFLDAVYDITCDRKDFATFRDIRYQYEQWCDRNGELKASEKRLSMEVEYYLERLGVCPAKDRIRVGSPNALIILRGLKLKK